MHAWKRYLPNLQIVNKRFFGYFIQKYTITHAGFTWNVRHRWICVVVVEKCSEELNINLNILIKIYILYHTHSWVDHQSIDHFHYFIICTMMTDWWLTFSICLFETRTMNWINRFFFSFWLNYIAECIIVQWLFWDRLIIPVEWIE